MLDDCLSDLITQTNTNKVPLPAASPSTDYYSYFHRKTEADVDVEIEWSNDIRRKRHTSVKPRRASKEIVSPTSYEDFSADATTPRRTPRFDPVISPIEEKEEVHNDDEEEDRIACRGAMKQKSRRIEGKMERRRMQAAGRASLKRVVPYCPLPILPVGT